MSDPRIKKLAEILVHYSLSLKPGEKLRIRTSPLADELSLAVYKEALLAGAHITVQNNLPGASEIFYKFANEEQLTYISPITRLITETWDADLYIDAEHNTRELSGVDPARMAMVRKAGAPLTKIYFERAAKGEIKWSLTVYPTHAMAQEADMSLTDYREFVYSACLLNEDDPVSSWRKLGKQQDRYIQ